MTIGLLNKMSVLVSVIIPSFNRSSLLPRAINSVLQQTYSNFELIIVDDGSSDNTLTLQQSYPDDRLKWIRHETNKGAAAARNSGIQNALGKYVAFLDSDDEWFPRKLEEQVSLMESSSPGVAASFTGFMLNRIDRNIREPRPLANIQNWRKHLTQGCNLSPGSTLMVRQAVFAQVGLFDERLNRFEDWEWLFRLTHQYQIRGISEILCEVHLGEWPGVNIVQEALVNFKHYISERHVSLNNDEKNRLMSILDIEISVALWRNGSRMKGAIDFIKNFCRSPFISLKFLIKIMARRIRRMGVFFFQENSAILMEGSQKATLSANKIATHLPNSETIELLGLKRKLIKNPFALFQKYQQGILVVHTFMTARNILLLILTLRWMCRGKIEIYDTKGVHKKITVKIMFSYLKKYIEDFIQKNKILKEIEHSCYKLNHTPIGNKPVLDLDKSPLYLRTDLVFGVRAGGSVGHIAGVLNNLSEFSGPPIFMTTDRIPTVQENIETFDLPLEDLCWNMPEVSNYAFNQSLLKFAVPIIQNRDLAFVYQRYSQGNISGLQLARQFNVPFVLEFNGSEVWIAENWGTPLRYAKLAKITEKTNLQLADLIVVVSKALQQMLVAEGISKDKILVNPNGVDVERYCPDVSGAAIRTQLGIENEFVIGFIGTFGAWHGAPLLAEAFGQLFERGLMNGVKLLLIGDGNTLPETREVIAKHGASNATIFTGLVPQALGPEYMAACDILVSPHIPNPDGSPFFGSPTKLFEYMAMGKAIIASNLDQIGEILQHDHTAWMVKPGCPKALSQAILHLKDNKELRLRLGNEARKEAVAKHSWRVHTAEIIEKLKFIIHD